ncbi:acyltransferase family protein [Cellulomonas xylanilytica]|uniref:Acyltransferase n=1 Tax=Cellulomonas xylanilytica TaxID=233583 RepID=A0A510V6U0_9CELL|nr:acyltransferase [Cellulomonas xylanilytica]GEK21641.1 acyltransferase [Cellulomonas xylanilytica]
MAGSAGRINSLQWLRFAAAFAVLLYHGAAYLSIMRGDQWAVSVVPSWLGAVGVAVFFALSGYLMSVMMMRYDASRFLLHRVVRLYPIYFVIVGLVVLAGVWSPIKPPLDVNALLLLPYGGSSYALGVEWTLVLEIVFYIFVAVLIALKLQKSAASALIGWLGLILIHNVLRPDNPAVNVFPAHQLPFIALNTAFAFGMLLPLVVTRWSPHPVLALILGTATWQLGSSINVTWSRWGLGFGAALVVLSLVRFTGWRTLFGDTTLGRLGNHLGNYSYALYLVHVPVIRTVYAVFPLLSPRRSFLLAVVVALLLSMPLGWLDMRMYRTLRARVDAGTPRVLAICASVFVALFAVQLVRFF